LHNAGIDLIAATADRSSPWFPLRVLEEQIAIVVIGVVAEEQSAKV
jgi:hypothetical protein